MAQDKRDFVRSVTQHTVEVNLPSGKRAVGHLRDVSVNGVFVETDGSFREGDACDVQIRLGQSEASIDASGHVTRVAKDGVGINFDAVDVEAFEHLKKLVMYNTDDPDKVEEEFDASVGIKRVGK